MAQFSKKIDFRDHMPRFTLKNWNIFPSISLETPYMCVEILRTRLVFLRWLIWGVTFLGKTKKWTFFHLPASKPHKCVLKPAEQGLFFSKMIDLKAYSKNWTFPIYLLRNAINCVETCRRVLFSETINLRDHLPRFTLKTEYFSNLSPWKPHKCVLKPPEQGPFFPKWSIWGIIGLGLLKNWIFFPSISLETPYMCIETLRTRLVSPRWSFWRVIYLGSF